MSGTTASLSVAELERLDELERLATDAARDLDEASAHEILQWAACKWGIAADVVRAQAVTESWWHQTQLGDWNSDPSYCAPGHGIGVPIVKLEQQTLEELLRLRLDQYAATTQPSERTTVMGQIDDTFKQISSNVHGESVGLLRLAAQVQEAKGDRYGSLETLKKAVNLMDKTSIKPSFQFDLIYDLAMSYRNLGQNKAAQERLLQVLRAYPGSSASYNYGPICVAESHRGRGLAVAMFEALKAQLPGREGFTFIRRDNTASLRVHTKMGMNEVAEFTHAGVTYVVVAYVE